MKRWKQSWWSARIQYPQVIQRQVGETRQFQRRERARRILQHHNTSANQPKQIPYSRTGFLLFSLRCLVLRMVCCSLHASSRFSCWLRFSLDWLTTAIQSTREVNRIVNSANLQERTTHFPIHSVLGNSPLISWAWVGLGRTSLSLIIALRFGAELDSAPNFSAMYISAPFFIYQTSTIYLRIRVVFLFWYLHVLHGFTRFVLWINSFSI